MFMMESVFFYIYKIAIIIFAAHSDMKKYKIHSDKPRKNLQISPCSLGSVKAPRETFTAHSIFWR